MDIERLTKSQIVLLTLLVSFVTSIATGIVTITLMEQAPPAITQTVNRIVERTVERVVPQAGQVAAAANVVTEKVVTVRESDLLVQAVAATDPSVVRLFAPGKDEAGKDIQLFAGLAIVSTEDGLMIADAGTPIGKLTALRPDGIEVPVTVAEKEEGSLVLLLQGATTTSSKKEDGTTEVKPLSWKAATFSTVGPSLGEAVIAIGGRTASRIGAGVITGLSEKTDKDDAGSFIETNIPLESYAAGSPLVNADGEIIGLATRSSRESGRFVASSRVLLYSKTVGNDASPAKTP